jgi:secreted trypsin-like serine protease
MMKRSSILFLILSLILSLILVVSIVLFFIIRLKSNEESVSDDSSLLLNSPCDCGCPLIEPLLNKRKRIINGEMSVEHSWPWEMLLVVIDINGQPLLFCGATLISDRHVITAGHCVHQHIPPFIYLFPGQHKFNLNISLSLSYPVNKIYVHENLNVLLHNDIAIVTLQERLRFDSFIYPICLPKINSSLLKNNEELISIGWGRLSSQPGTNIYPENLQQVKLFYIPTSHPNCSNIFKPITNIHPGQMCVGNIGFNTCHGDSGGALMKKDFLSNTNQFYWQLIGIASKTIDCGFNSTSPDIFINIQYYYQWIIQTIKRSQI